jgi:cell division protein FtsI (penicillin-binding protein 3)
MVPDVKNGDVLAADIVLEQLGVNTDAPWLLNDGSNSPVWGQTGSGDNGVTLSRLEMNDHTVPDVQGMGARDAVFILERLGLTVEITGTGHVVSQSIAPGTELSNNTQVCHLTMGN